MPIAPAEPAPAIPEGVLPADLEEAVSRYLAFGTLLGSVAPGGPRPLFAAANRAALIASFLQSGCTEALRPALDRDLRRLHRDPQVVAAFARPKRPRWRRWLERRLPGLIRPPEQTRLPKLRDLVPIADHAMQFDAAVTSFRRLLAGNGEHGPPPALIAGVARILFSPEEAARFVAAEQAREDSHLSLLFELAIAGERSPLDPALLAAALADAIRKEDADRRRALARMLIDRPLLSEAAPLLTDACAAELDVGDAAEALALAQAWHFADPGSPATIALACAEAGADRSAAIRRLANVPDGALLRAGWLCDEGRHDEAEQLVRAALPREFGPESAEALLLLHTIYARRGDPADFAAAMFGLEGCDLAWEDTGEANWLEHSLPTPSPDRMVTVILDARPDPGGACATIASVLGQSHRSLELLVIGDSDERVAHPGDPRVHVVDRIDPADLAGELVAFARAGDRWLRNRLAEHLQAHACDADLVATVSRRLIVDPAGGFVRDARGRFRLPDFVSPVVVRSQAADMLGRDPSVHDPARAAERVRSALQGASVAILPVTRAIGTQKSGGRSAAVGVPPAASEPELACVESGGWPARLRDARAMAAAGRHAEALAALDQALLLLPPGTPPASLQALVGERGDLLAALGKAEAAAAFAERAHRLSAIAGP